MITFDFTSMKWQGITKSQFMLWESLYPEINVDHEIQIEMVKWLDRMKGTKKAQKKRWDRFISKWLERANIKEITI